MPKKKDHSGWITVLVWVVAVMLLLIGILAVYETTSIRKQFEYLAYKDVPILAISGRVALLSLEESDLLEKATRLGLDFPAGVAAQPLAAMQRAFKEYNVEIDRQLLRGQRAARVIGPAADKNFDGNQVPYLDALVSAHEKQEQYTSICNQLFAALMRGDRVNAEALYAIASKREEEMKSAYQTVLTESQRSAGQAIGTVRRGEASAIRSLAATTAAALAVALWIVFLIRQIMLARRRAEAMLEHIAIHDELTGLYNRRHLLTRLDEALHAARRHNLSLSLCICDLDRFKEANDNHGHGLGDEVLQRFAQRIRTEIRTEDIAGRYGGDEFVIVFPNTAARESRSVVERIRAGFEQEVFFSNRGAAFSLSATFGLADLSPAHTDDKKFFETADQALYEAKNQGRNCVVAVECAPLVDNAIEPAPAS